MKQYFKTTDRLATVSHTRNSKTLITKAATMTVYCMVKSLSMIIPIKKENVLTMK